MLYVNKLFDLSGPDWITSKYFLHFQYSNMFFIIYFFLQISAYIP